MTNTTNDGVRVDPIDEWLKTAVADAERRGLHELKPLLETLAQSTRRLRTASWGHSVPTGGAGLARRSPKGGAGLAHRSPKGGAGLAHRSPKGGGGR